MSSCSKQNAVDISKNSTTPTTLLTSIVDNTPNSYSFGQKLFEFFYNGKQLTKAQTYSYNLVNSQTTVDTTILNFIYDNTGEIISVGGPAGTSLVSYNGNNINEVKAAYAGIRDFTFSYQTGKLVNWAWKDIPDHGYYYFNCPLTYDANGNVTEENVQNSGSVANGTETYQYYNYDNKNSLSNAFTLPSYIIVSFIIAIGDYDHYLGYSHGNSVNNPTLMVFDDGVSTTSSNITYEYNSYNFPSMISYSANANFSAESYKYSYIQVN